MNESTEILDMSRIDTYLLDPFERLPRRQQLPTPMLDEDVPKMNSKY